MAKCIIFCAGEFHGLIEPICAEDYIIAADGGLHHTEHLSITPHLILGDFDSLDHTPENAVVFPVEKDDTDAMLAVKAGLEKGYRQFVFYGALEGPRLDHTMANLQTLSYLNKHGATGFLVGKTQIATAILSSALTFPATAKGIISLFATDGDAQGVSITGLKYPLENATLTPNFPLGVSNHFTDAKAEISVKNGTLLILYSRENGLPY